MLFNSAPCFSQILSLGKHRKAVRDNVITDALDFYEINKKKIKFRDHQRSGYASSKRNNAIDEVGFSSNRKKYRPPERTYRKDLGKITGNDGIKKKKRFESHNFLAGWETSRYQYEEPGVMKDKGVMKGIYGEYTYTPVKKEFLYSDNIDFYKIEGKHSWGHVDYEAETDTQAGSRIDNIADYIYEIRGLVGKTVIDEEVLVKFYSGLGYRYLNDDSGGMVSGLGFYGYERESNYYYLPLGMEFGAKIDKNWEWIFKGEYDWLIYGQQISHLSDGNQFPSVSGNKDVKNNQDEGHGFRASFMLARRLGLCKLSVEPFVRYWKIEDSDVNEAFADGRVFLGLEPKNNTLEYGVKFGMDF